MLAAVDKEIMKVGVFWVKARMQGGRRVIKNGKGVRAIVDRILSGLIRSKVEFDGDMTDIFGVEVVEFSMITLRSLALNVSTNLQSNIELM